MLSTKESKKLNQEGLVERAMIDYAEELKAFIRARISSNLATEDLLQEIWYQLSKTIQSTDIQAY